MHVSKYILIGNIYQNSQRFVYFLNIYFKFHFDCLNLILREFLHIHSLSRCYLPKTEF